MRHEGCGSEPSVGWNLTLYPDALEAAGRFCGHR